MLTIYSLLFGAIQGLAEFLPVSSSGHLVILHHFFDLQLGDSLSFDVALHWGTLAALLIFFWSDIVKLLKAWFGSFRGNSRKSNFEAKLAWMILVATIPAVIVGFLAEDLLAQYFGSPQSVAIWLIAVGGLFFVLEKVSLKNRSLENISWGGAIAVGLAQALALIPGVSRSGITIITGLGQNLKRADAARFSFLLSIPAVFGAGLKKFYDLSKVGLPSGEALLFAVGLVSAALVGYFCLKYFLKYLENHSLAIFGWYRIILGVLVLLLVYYA
ncbi:MAG: undecaprenyl-diphosphatase UppP [Patescibacteria group bacterium]|jgi:undecaprenyl-diphosphatase